MKREMLEPFNFYFVSGLIRFGLFYLSFLFLNFYVVPRILRKENLWLNIFSVLLVVAIVALAMGAMGTYMKDQFLPWDKPGREPYYIIYQKSILYSAWLLLLFVFYTFIRYASIYILSNSKEIEEKYKFIKPGTLIAFVFWMIIMFLLLAGKAEKEVNVAWAVVVLFSIFYYNYSFHTLIPAAYKRKRPFRFYMLRTILLLLISYLPIFIISMALAQDEDRGAVISFFNVCFQFFLFAPVTWFLFKRHLKGNEVIYSLKQALGRSHANLDFLRSQINPHFLFNALNTIYGMALQENAERTSSGIEKLGDMMRFMLQENMQEKIALSREIDYLNNYISFQKLRTESKSNVSIMADIDQPRDIVQIAPMLLIPFVENAFKHGISFREPSYINITLEMREKVLHFDVSNSKHLQQDNDPEKGKSGIGLDNVKQRLQLIYPNRHDLQIRETKKDFFVHLTIRLS